MSGWHKAEPQRGESGDCLVFFFLLAYVAFMAHDSWPVPDFYEDYTYCFLAEGAAFGVESFETLKMVSIFFGD